MGHQRGDAVLKAIFIPAGERHIVGVGAYTQVTSLSIRSPSGNGQEESSQELKEGRIHKAFPLYWCNAEDPSWLLQIPGPRIHRERPDRPLRWLPPSPRRQTRWRHIACHPALCTLW